MLYYPGKRRTNQSRSANFFTHGGSSYKIQRSDSTGFLLLGLSIGFGQKSWGMLCLSDAIMRQCGCLLFVLFWDDTG